MDTNETNKYFLPAAVILAGLFIGGVIMWSNTHPTVPAPSPSGAAAAPAVDVKNVKTDGSPYLGQANAPVVIAVWSDYQCPFCKKFEIETMPEIIKNYVDTGKVKVVFLDFVFLGDDSIAAAAYSQSVWKLYPNKYFEWRIAMYTAQDQEGDQGFGDAESIDKLNATISGIDAAKVAADVKANMSAYQTRMNADKAEAQKVGINATPSSIVGTQIIAGAYPYETFQTTIDALLK